MKPDVKELCRTPRAFYDDPEASVDDDNWSESEKEYPLNSMAADAEHAQEFGERPPLIWAISSALSKLEGDRGFPPVKERSSEGKTALGNIVVAISGNPEVDTPINAAAKEIARTADAHVHYVSVVSHVTDPSEYGALAPVGPPGDPGSVGLIPLEEAVEQRREDFEAFAKDQSLPESVSSEVRTGLIDEEIIQAAEDCQAALILVGSGKHKWPEGMLSSDVAKQVVAKSGYPVLVVPESAMVEP